MQPTVHTVILTDPYQPEVVRFDDLRPGDAFALADASTPGKPFGLYVKLPASQELGHVERGSSLLPAMDLPKLRLGLFNPSTRVVRIRLDITLKYRLES